MNFELSLGTLLRRAYHPKAFLSLKRNIRPGLIARTQIILQLEKDALSARAISQDTELSYAAALHHIHLLEAENILVRRGKKPFHWELTGAGQQRLT